MTSGTSTSHSIHPPDDAQWGPRPCDDSPSAIRETCELADASVERFASADGWSHIQAVLIITGAASRALRGLWRRLNPQTSAVLGGTPVRRGRVAAAPLRGAKTRTLGTR